MYNFILPGCQELIRRCLTPECSQRILLDDILKHPWMQQDNLTTMPTTIAPTETETTTGNQQTTPVIASDTSVASQAPSTSTNGSTPNVFLNGPRRKKVMVQQQGSAAVLKSTLPKRGAVAIADQPIAAKTVAMKSSVALFRKPVAMKVGLFIVDKISGFFSV